MFSPETLRQMVALLEASRQLCQTSAQLRRTSRDLCDRGARLHSISMALRAEAATLRQECARFHAQPDTPCVEAPPIADDWPADNPHEAAMEVLRVIRTLIDSFPLLWQIAIVKALTARAIVMTHDRLHPAPSALSA
jgi:hypothetical protein